ncbi:MAG: helix-turn-helix transcriptional regulator [Kiritimatiellia bacterium]
MAYLPEDFCRKVAAARREQGLTQSALAKAVGCAQSAVSMFERGHPEKLSIEFVEKIAGILKIPMEEKTRNNIPEFLPAFSLQKGYCPNPACLSNIPYIINDELFVWPELSLLTGNIKYCATCGEVLECCCPGCARPITEGACCQSCGHPRVMATLPPGVSSELWVVQRRNEIQQWRSLRSSHAVLK